MILNINRTSVDTTDATATAADITQDKTAYINGEKITGTLITQGFFVGTSAPTASIGSNNDMFFVIEE